MGRKSVIIIGAGPSGMAAASHLLDKGVGFLVIEKQSDIGGLAKTINHGGYKLDIGPHILCSEPYIYDYNEEMHSFVNQLLGSELIDYKHLNLKYLETVRVKSAEFLYPIQVANALKSVGPIHAFKIIKDYISAILRDVKGDKKEPSFEQVMASHLGQSLAELFILDYSEKIWGYECSSLSADMAWRVGDFSILQVLKDQFSNIVKGLSPHSGHPVCYPNHGIGSICQHICDRVVDSELGHVHTKSFPVNIQHDEGFITEMTVNENGILRTYDTEYVISSMPINELVQLLDPSPPNEVIVSAKALKFRAHLCLYLLVEKECVMSEHCIYFPDHDVPFARMMEQKNYSNIMCPEGKTALAVEIFCWYGDEFWNMDDSQLFRHSLSSLEDMDIVKENEVYEYFVHRERYAYPVYDIGYSEHLGKVMDYISTLKNLRLVGRAGAFTYMGQYRAMKDGIMAAESIISSDMHEAGDL